MELEPMISVMSLQCSSRSIDHFTVLCSVTRPLNKSQAGVDLVHYNKMIYVRKAARFVSKLGQLQPRYYSRPGN